jgi:hypothetical protein
MGLRHYPQTGFYTYSLKNDRNTFAWLDGWLADFIQQLLDTNLSKRSGFNRLNKTDQSFSSSFGW